MRVWQVTTRLQCRAELGIQCSFSSECFRALILIEAHNPSESGYVEAVAKEDLLPDVLIRPTWQDLISLWRQPCCRD